MKDILTKILFIIVIFLCLYGINFYNKTQENIKYRENTEDVLPSDMLIVTFLDVGEADAILLNANGHYALIDGGNNEDGEKLVNYFKEQGITRFDYIFGTHPHEDHIGGLDYIIREFKVGKVYMPDVKVDNLTYQDIINVLEEKHIKLNIPKIDSTLKLGKAKIRVIFTGTDNENLNDSSIVLKLLYGENSYLFMADASYEVEKQILDKNISSDVLKVGHHGSNYSTSANFLYKVYPKFAVISVGKDNDYGFPKKGTLNKLERINAKVYRTDLDGTIITTSDGKNITFEKVQTDTNGIENR